MWQSNSRMSLSFVESKGLLNEPGDNNCFLNSAVQVLWHLDVFRRSFRLLTGHMCMGNACIFCALKVIFTQFQYSDQSALPPDALRKALAKTFKDQQRFQLGLMDDAAECFENILTRIHGHITNGVPDDKCTAAHCISHQKFTQTLLEQVICPCGATSEAHIFNQMVHYVATNVLCAEKFKLCSGSVNNFPPSVFTHLLKNASSLGDTRNCPNNCGRQSHILKTLTNTPEVISVGLIWNSDRPNQTVIQQVIDAIGTKLLLSQLYESVKVPLPQEEFHLVGVVCYYGKHYSTFFYHSKKNTWISFDDANVKEMGSWHYVAEKCCRGHYQPLLLLYASPVPEPVSIDTALQKTIMVTGHSFSNESLLRSAGEHNRQGSSSSVERALHPGGQNQQPGYEASHLCVNQQGAEWGRYESDEEVEGQTSNGGGHFRQSSYLSAMEAMAAKSGQTADEHNIGVSAPHPGSTNQPTPHTALNFHSVPTAEPLDSNTQSGASHLPHVRAACENQHQTSYPSHCADTNGHCNKNYMTQKTPKWPNSGSIEQQSKQENVNNNVIFNNTSNHRSNIDQNVQGTVIRSDQAQWNYPVQSHVGCDAGKVRTPNPPDSHSNVTYTAHPSRYPNYQHNTYGQQDSWQSEEGSAAYIDRKAVERVLGLQGSKHSQPARGVITAHHMGRQPVYGDSTHSVDTDSQASTKSHQARYTYMQPTPYVHADSQKDSAYCSSGSAGDRNSSSSSSSSLMERLIRSAANPPALLEHQAEGSMSQPTVDKRFSSEESLSSASAGSIGTVKANGKPTNYTNNRSKSQESLTIIEDNTKPVRDLIKKMDQPAQRPVEGRGGSERVSVPARGEGLARPSKENVHADPAIYTMGGSERKATEESLFRQADGLMEMCARKQQTGDHAAALVHCQQAIGNLQLLLKSDIRENVKLPARVKLQSCVERSRALHVKVQMSRQESVTSDLSNTSGDINSSSSTEDTRYRDTGHLHASSAVGGYSSKTVEFPVPGSVNVVHTVATEDFPAYVPLSQRRKFMSDYVSKEDYFSHHPRPPQKAPKPSVNSGSKVNKPVVPPKPGPKPFLKHSISSENETHPGQARTVDEEGSINIYATLPRRPKNRERSSTLTGSEQSSVYRACLEKQPGVSSGHGNVNTLEIDRAAVPQQKPEVSKKPGQVKGTSIISQPPTDQSQRRDCAEGRKTPQFVQDKSNLVNHSRQWSKEEIRDLLVKDYYQSRTDNSQSGSKPSLESMVNEQMKQLTLNSRKSSRKQERDCSQEVARAERVLLKQTSSQWSACDTSDLRTTPVHREGCSIQRVPPQQCVSKPDITASHNHPNVTIRAPRGQSTLETFTKLEAHQLALLHRPEEYSSQERTTDRQKREGSPSQNMVVPGYDVPAAQLCRKSNNNVAVVGLSQKPQDRVKPGGVAEQIEELPPPPPELLEPLSQTDSSQPQMAHFGPTPHNQLHSLDSYVVPGLQSIVDCSKISFAPHSADQSRAYIESYRKDKDLADFCVISKKDCDPYNDLSSSSGIERTDTQSDTSSVSTANSRNSRTSQGKHSKPALVKRNRLKPRKSVTFSDNVMLIARARDDGEQVPEEPNYIEYVQQLLKRSPVKCEEKWPVASTTHKVAKGEAKTGYDSDFDEDTTDSCTSDEVSNTDRVQCNLCRKKLIEASYIYCVDCSAYMAKFQPT